MIFFCQKLCGFRGNDPFTPNTVKIPHIRLSKGHHKIFVLKINRVSTLFLGRNQNPKSDRVLRSLILFPNGQSTPPINFKKQKYYDDLKFDLIKKNQT